MSALPAKLSRSLVLNSLRIWTRDLRACDGRCSCEAYAPGLLSPRQVGNFEPQTCSPASPRPRRARTSGRWMRRGSKIVLYGV